MSDEKADKWFVDRVAQDPDYIRTAYLPALKRLEDKAAAALHQAIRTESEGRIKYRLGWLDGVRETLSVLNGLKYMSDAKKPAEPGLMARIFGNGQSQEMGYPPNLG